jgi:hypothetical protein
MFAATPCAACDSAEDRSNSAIYPARLISTPCPGLRGSGREADEERAFVSGSNVSTDTSTEVFLLDAPT